MKYFTKYIQTELAGDIKEGDEVAFTQWRKLLRKKIKRVVYNKMLDKASGIAFVVVEGTKLEFFQYEKKDYPIRYFGGTHYQDSVIKLELKPERIGLAKMFLCSRDIQVGNEIFGKRTNGWDTEHKGIVIKQDREYNIILEESKEVMLYKCGKVIGEISPDALSYVKEGQEFDEDEVQWGDPQFEWNHPIIVKIKCSCCGAFR